MALGSMNILTVKIVLIHEYMLSLHLFLFVLFHWGFVFIAQILSYLIEYILSILLLLLLLCGNSLVCGSSLARDQTQTIAVTMLNP